MLRLHPGTLNELNSGVAVPDYDRQSLRPGIVHLGLGAFHRAHQAVYTEQALASSGGDWGIIGVSLRSESVSQKLLPQDGLYSVMSEDASGHVMQVIGAIQQVLVAPRELERVIAAIVDQRIQLVTLTITEKGYCLAEDGRSLNVDDKAVEADLGNPLAPVSAVGVLSLGLKERVAAGGAPLSLLSCDNLSQNSNLLKTVLVDYLERSFPEVIAWLEQSASFPCSMVDRIVPAMTAEQAARQASLLGLIDEGAVVTEPFKQWIIEDSFAAGRPDWESAGAQMVSDILPYEKIKLGLLNASHSAIAYCGLVAGLERVDQVMADSALRAYVERLMANDLMPRLDVPDGFDLPTYRDQLLERFGNPCLAHRCQQIAMDGSEKISQRWLPILQGTKDYSSLKIALAAWCYYLLHTRFEINDPRSRQLQAWRNSNAEEILRVQGVLACARITPDSVAGYDDLCAQLLEHLRLLSERDIRSLIACA